MWSFSIRSYMAFQLIKNWKLLSSHFISLFQFPLKAMLCYPKIITTSIIDSKISRFRFILSLYALLNDEYILGLVPSHTAENCVDFSTASLCDTLSSWVFKEDLLLPTVFFQSLNPLLPNSVTLSPKHRQNL